MARFVHLLLCLQFISTAYGNRYICDPGCQNGGTCQFGVCLCPAEFTGVFCESECPVPEYLDVTDANQVTSFLNLTITCHPNTVTVTMSECELSEMIGDDVIVLTDPNDPVLVTSSAQPECLPTTDDDKVTLHAPHELCGAPIETTPELFVHEYAIATARDLAAITLIYRPRYKLFMKFSCEISRIQTVELAAAVVPYYKSVSVSLPTTEGQIYLTAGFMGSNSSEIVNEQITVTVPDTISIAFVIEGDIEGDYTVQATSCFATPTVDFSGPIRHTIIRDGCFLDNSATTTSINETTYLNFDAFVWSQLPSPQSIYVTCNLSVCQTDQCPELCTRRSSRQTTDLLISNQLLTFGPISINAGGCENAECDSICSMNETGELFCMCFDGDILNADGTTCAEPIEQVPNWWIYLLVFGILILLALIVVAIYLLRRRKFERETHLQPRPPSRATTSTAPYVNPYFINS